jgi:enoyl-CoA hydratase
MGQQSDRGELGDVDYLLVDDESGVRTITFNRPEAKNALTVAMRRELCELLDSADQDAAVHAVILTGTDPVFTAGVDYKEVDPTFDPRQRRWSVNPGKALRGMRTPVICAVNGGCVSGGLEIALSSAFVIASERARFADTHARLNVLPAWGLTALLPRAVGLRKAKEMSITGNFVNADQALRIGIANHVVAHEELMPFTRELVGQIARTVAVADILSIYEQAEDLGFSAALALEAAHVAMGPEWDSAAFATAGRAAAARQRQS